MHATWKMTDEGTGIEYRIAGDVVAHDPDRHSVTIRCPWDEADVITISGIAVIEAAKAGQGGLRVVAARRVARQDAERPGGTTPPP